ncbi:MAG: HD domain-containing protein [Candidatus Aminicenantes bacterium]
MKKILLKPSRNIRVKTSLFVLFLLMLAIGSSYFIIVHMMRERILNEVIKRGEALSRSIASSAGYSFINQDILGLDTLVFKVKDSNPDIENIAIVDSQNNIRVHSDINLSGEKYISPEGAILSSYIDGTIVKGVKNHSGGYFEISSPIAFMDKPLGSVVLHINESVLVTAQRKMHNEIRWVFLIILLMGTASTVFLSSFLTRPIEELSKGVKELKEGKNSQPLKVYSQDELGRLTESFNDMSALITNQKNELKKFARDLEDSYVSTVKVLAAAIDARDHYTLGHSSRVARLSVELGRRVNLSKQKLEELEVACLFHDVGKIKIPDSILLKEGKLEKKEMDEMKKHPEYGSDILAKAPSLVKYIPVVRHHHEWYDGSGYPDGLSGDDIPLTAAIASLADVFDALTSDRPYRSCRSQKEALQTIEELAGKQFSSELARIFIKMVKKK